MSLPEHARFRPSGAVASRIIEGQAVVVSLDRRVMHELNEVGSRVWELLEDRSLGEIADRVVQEFDVTREQALDDVRAFIASLADLDAVERVS